MGSPMAPECHMHLFTYKFCCPESSEIWYIVIFVTNSRLSGEYCFVENQAYVHQNKISTLLTTKQLSLEVIW